MPDAPQLGMAALSVGWADYGAIAGRMLAKPKGLRNNADYINPYKNSRNLPTFL